MPTAALAFALTLALAPAAARGDTLRLALFDGPAPRAGPHLELPALSLPEAFPALRDEGGGAGGQRVEPALCLVLGIIPGFGLGHLLAGSPQWPIWLVADIVIAFVAWGPFFYWDARPGYFPVFSLLVLVERVVEGVSAYQAAGGGGGGRRHRAERGWAERDVAPAELALPVGAPSPLRW